MTHAFVKDGIIQATGQLMESARRLDTQEWVLGLFQASVELQQACGWFLVVEVARPIDTTTDTTERSVQLIDGVPTEVWVPRPWSVEELAQQASLANRSAIETNLTDDMVKMQTLIDVTNATLNAGPAPFMKDIARNLRRLDRLAINDLDGST